MKHTYENAMKALNYLAEYCTEKNLCEDCPLEMICKKYFKKLPGFMEEEVKNALGLEYDEWGEGKAPGPYNEVCYNDEWLN